MIEQNPNPNPIEQPSQTEKTNNENTSLSLESLNEKIKQEIIKNIQNSLDEIPKNTDKMQLLLKQLEIYELLSKKDEEIKISQKQKKKSYKILHFWKNLKDIIPTTLFVSVFLWFFGLYSGYQTELRETRNAQNSNDQKILENYFNTIKELRSSAIPNQSDNAIKEQQNLINNMTLISLRELSQGSDEKSMIVLLLYKSQIPENFTKEKSDDSFYKGADLKFLDLKGYILPKANLSKADLRGTNLINADLTGANLSYVDLSCYSLEKPDYWGWLPFKLSPPFLKEETDIIKQETKCGDLTGAILKDADLTGVNLTDVNLEGANLEGANLEGANLTGIKLTETTIVKNAKFGNNLGIYDALKMMLTQQGATF